MDSARKYTSVSTDAFMRSRSVNVVSAKTFAQDLEEKARKSDNLGSNLNYLQGKFNEIKTAKASHPVKQEEDLRSAIRFMCFNLLLMLLFGRNGGNSLDEILGLGDGSSGDSLWGDGLLGSSDLQFEEVTDRFECTHYEAEFEGTMFAANGIVKTSDGREIDFNIDLMMSRSFEHVVSESESFTSFKARLCDPLVINLDIPAAEVSDQKFYFDLDADGIKDEVSMLSTKSGFLALDLNEDGEINDGSELFGTKSGDGFADLAKYDSDGNGWIDEADEVFDKLKIFCINEDGTATQYAIKEKGVGAIYLGNKQTEFSVTNAENMLNAQIRKTGIFLYETGGIGTVQHVDLNVELGA